MIKIAIDAMGGDNAPKAIINGVIKALKVNNEFEAYLYGKEDLISTILNSYKIDEEYKNRIVIVNCTEVIEFNDPPTEAFRTKKDSSLVVASNDLKNSKVDALISAGSTGALIVCGIFIIGRSKNIERPAICTFFPSKKGIMLVLDSGANAECKPHQLFQFAQIGSVYAKEVLGIEKPKVGLLNIGTEEEKGNILVHETNLLLKDANNLNYIGYIESRDAILGGCDVLVCDGFTGNIFLKSFEGTAKLLFGTIKEVFKMNIFTMIGALLIKNSFKKALKRYDYKQSGGSPIMGLNKIIIKIHGNTEGDEIAPSIIQAIKFIKNNVNDRINNNI